MSASPDYLAKMAQCEMAARFAPAGVADFWHSAADCYLLLAELSHGEAESAAAESEPRIIETKLTSNPRLDGAQRREGWIG